MEDVRADRGRQSGGNSASAGLLRSIVEKAVLAPSSHNTQPWAFRLRDNQLELYADRSRALPVNDPRDRELTISCGAALLNARLTAERAGAELDVVPLPEGEGSDLLARATLEENGDAADESLFAAIAARRTYRKDFADRAVPGDLVARLCQAATAEAAGLEALSPDARAALVALVAKGDRKQFADRSWRHELAAWMHPRRRGEGLVVGELAGPATRFVVRHLDLGGIVAGRDAKLAERSPVLAVLTTRRDTVLDWLAAGQALQRVLLTAAATGLLASYLNQPVQVDELRPRLAKLLDCGGFPQVVLRLGYPQGEARAAPRRSVSAVLRGADHQLPPAAPRTLRATTDHMRSEYR